MENKKTQIIKYGCCGQAFAACLEPDCYTDKDWLKNLKKYVERGDTVEMVESGKGLNLRKCDCKTKKEPTAIRNANQITLF